MRKTVLDPNDILIAETYNSVGMAYDVQNMFEEALINFSQALKIYKTSSISTPSHLPYVAATINNIGGVYDKVCRKFTVWITYSNLQKR